MMDGIELPRLYIAENKHDAELAVSKGIPFIRWTQGQDALIRMLLRPVLEQMFPHIKWNLVLGKRRKFRTMVEICEGYDDMPDQVDEVGRIDGKAGAEENDWSPEQAEDEVDMSGLAITDEDGIIVETAGIANGERLFADDKHKMVVVHNLDIEDYIGDMSSYVNIEMLQRLRLMPAFIGNILDCVKINVGSGIHWAEGYNKRRGLPIGRYNASGQLPNLVILDVSGSIPRGISATMISLIDTLRTQLSADLIITSTNSRFYPMGSELPTPQRIRDMFGYGNEQSDFFGILTKNIRGKHYGHVFSFGDNDTPYYADFLKHPEQWSLEGTVVEHVHHYHTGKWGNGKTGYAKWCHMLSKPPLEEYDTSWCDVIAR
jgi:hypothetical protein